MLLTLAMASVKTRRSNSFKDSSEAKLAAIPELQEPDSVWRSYVKLLNEIMVKLRQSMRALMIRELPFRSGSRFPRKTARPLE